MLQNFGLIGIDFERLTKTVFSGRILVVGAQDTADLLERRELDADSIAVDQGQAVDEG